MDSEVSASVEEHRAGYTVAEVMRPAVTAVETGSHLAAAAYLMTHAEQTALIVVDLAERPVAIITEDDLLRAVAHGEDTGEALISDWMSPDPRTVRPDTAITEAARIMLDCGRLHLPVVSDGQVVGIVSINDVVAALVRSVRLASAVVFVSDLERSVDFYEALLRYNVTARQHDTALLAGPESQLYLHQAAAGPAADNRRAGVQWLAWTAGDPQDLERCAQFLQSRGALERRETLEDISRVEGRDPDGLPVVVTHPGPDVRPRHVITERILQA